MKSLAATLALAVVSAMLLASCGGGGVGSSDPIPPPVSHYHPPRTPSTSPNVVQLENQKPGDNGWSIQDYADEHEIEGYASRTSVTRGENIEFFVSTVDPTYQLDIYRMGWYGGAGARLLQSFPAQVGILQVKPAPGALGFLECTWVNPLTISVPKGSDATVWASGTYLVKLTSSTGKQSYIPFVVRDDARSSDIFFVANVNTYQAYNNWGGRSLYPEIDPDGIAAQRISFNRPYANDLGAGQFLSWEYNMVRFLEREGFDVTYATNVDVHENLTMLEQHSVFLDTGHDEYWTWETRDNVEAALANGESIGFIAGNICWWQIRYDISPATGDADRTIIGYKTDYQQDPYYSDGNPEHRERTTFLWDSSVVNRPAATLEGIEYFAGAKTRDMQITDTSFFAFDGTGISTGSQIAGVVGGEVDHQTRNSPSNLQILAATPVAFDGGTAYAQMADYTDGSGAIVLATGSFQFSWGLDSYVLDDTHSNYENAAAEAFAKNALNGMIHRQ